MATAHATPAPKHMDAQPSNLSSDTKQTGLMSCPSPLPVSSLGPEAGGLASPPWSADSPEQCGEHEESLSLFCLDDLEPLCKQCAAVGHAGHRVYLLTEAATDCKVGIMYHKEDSTRFH